MDSGTKPPGGKRGAATGRPAGANVRRRRGGAPPGGAAAGGQGGQGGGGGGQPIAQREALRFYTDEAPGLMIGPTTVLVLSVSFIGLVVLLHIYGKITG